MIRKIGLWLIVAVFAFVTFGCPPKNIRKADPYIKDAERVVKVVHSEYPNIRTALLDSCEAQLVSEEFCADFEALDPAIKKALAALGDAIALYQDAVDEYEAALGGDEESVSDAYTRVMAALGVVIGQTAELAQLYFEIMSIYRQVEVID